MTHGLEAFARFVEAIIGSRLTVIRDQYCSHKPHVGSPDDLGGNNPKTITLKQMDVHLSWSGVVVYDICNGAEIAGTPPMNTGWRYGMMFPQNIRHYPF